jgi:hypothetical protein
LSVRGTALRRSAQTEGRDLVTWSIEAIAEATRRAQFDTDERIRRRMRRRLGQLNRRKAAP